MYSDLHCHPTGRNFPHFSDYYRANKSKDAHPWVILNGSRKSLRLGKRATSYDQSDFARIVEGRMTLVFAALYPFEHGFYNKVRDVPLGNGTKYRDYLDEQNSPPGLTLKTITGTSVPRLKYIRSNKYEYWRELWDEYDFIARKSGVKETVKVKIDQDENPNNIDPRDTKVSGTYYLVADNPNGPNLTPPTQYSDPNRSFKSKNQMQKDSRGEAFVILTIEGMHALSMKNQCIPVSRQKLLERIKDIKVWDPPIFFITLAHHFDNNLCSHAHSMFRIGILGDWNPDQRKNMNYWGNRHGKTPTQKELVQGFSKLGFEVAHELLNIKKSGGKLVPKQNNGRRILIDTKHMSASARLDLYEKVIKPYNANNPSDLIPVIASHSAYSGETTLMGHIRRYENEEDDFSPLRISDFYPDYGFNPWNINVCDEDVQMIVQSKGLVGLSFDERVLGASERWKKRYGKKTTGIYLLANNIIGMAEACRSIGKHKFVASSSSYTFWDCITLGSDFNGVVDPVDSYPTVEQYDDFESHIGKALLEYPEIKSMGINSQNIKTVVRKMCIDNAWAFVKKHF